MRDLLADLNSAQRRAVTHGAGPLLIVAGAGTGKTTVLTRRYAYLADEPLAAHAQRSSPATPHRQPSTANHRPPTDHLLALTFTDKAAGEMEDRTLELLPNGTYDFWISTFHSFCQRILEQYALEIGLPHRFRVFNDTDAWLFARRHLERLPLARYRPLGNPLKFLSAFLAHISRAKDEGVAPEQYLEFAEQCALNGDAEFVTGERARLTELAECYGVYQRLLREEGALDFGDLIIETLRLLRERPAVLRALQEQFTHILVDEFQDTNWAQYALVKLLAGERKNLTVVGDDDQAIYKFRGASLANILQFRQDFPEAATVSLKENYRSCQEILDCAISFIRHNNPHRLEVSLQELEISKSLESKKGDGGLIDVRWYATLEEEAEGVARRILELHAEHPELGWNAYAVLSRSNDGCEPFIHALARHRIPYRFVALRGLYAKPLILDLVALFSLADGLRDAPTVWRAVNAPCYSFTANELAAFLKYAAQHTWGSLWEALATCRTQSSLRAETVERAERFVSQILTLAEAARRERPLKLLQRALHETGLLTAILALPERAKLEAFELLNAFAHRIQRYEDSARAPSLKEFLDELRQEIESGEEGALPPAQDLGPEEVQVLTVHAAKGLEFEHVFVVSLVDQRFPTRARSEVIALPDGLVNERLPEGTTHLEEERRLFYVALTRARTSVTLTGAENYGGARKKKPSVFLEEAGVLHSTLQPLPASQTPMMRAAPLEEHPIAEMQSAFPLKRRFSFTQLAAFRRCPLQYQFAHVYRIPVVGSFQKSYGQSLHLALHDILELHCERGNAQQMNLFGGHTQKDDEHETGAGGGFRVSVDEVLQIFESRWIDEWYPSREMRDRFFAEGKEAIKRLHALWRVTPPSVLHLELPFEWRIGERSVKGSVDRIDALPEGGVAILDYKTGEPKREDALETSDKEQLWMYQLAMEDRGFAVRRLSYVYVRTGMETSIPLLVEETRATFRAKLLERMNEILCSQFPPTPSPYLCKTCDFRSICEFRRV